MQEKPDKFIIQNFAPAYFAHRGQPELAARAGRAVEMLGRCEFCPRSCGVNRQAGEAGVCQTGRYARVSSAFAHFGEEVCLRGRGGSGTIFFAQCNLRCVFCQNADISQGDDGRECSAQALAELMLKLQEQGCHNINLVTPTHVLPQMLEALALAVDAGLHLPIVYNTGGYDALSALKLLDGLVDIYMPDFKLWDPSSCARYLGARDYAHHARQAITEMHRQVGDLSFTPEGIACRGLLIRHLVMPGLPNESAEIFRWLAEEISPDTYVNIMAQYRPAHKVGAWYSADDPRSRVCFEEINRTPTNREIAEARRLACSAGLWRFDKA